METVVQINDFVNGIVWGAPLLFLIFATGIYFTVRLGFIQFLNFGWLFRNTIVKSFKNKDNEPVGLGELTSFQAAMTSVSAIVGSGNIAGVATAIVAGGPGALLWMILAAFVGMASKFAEIALGVRFRKVNADGTVYGGAMYYLSNGLKMPWLGSLFAVLVIPFSFMISGVVDTNTIALTLYDRFGVSPTITGVILAVIVASIVFGGIRRVGYACALVAPFMGALYLLTGLAIIVLNIAMVPDAIMEIFRSAFTPTALAGGAVGSVMNCIKSGVARGIYSNEAGLGTAAMVHSGAKVNHPIEQAIWGPVEVFLDTVVVCTISALAIVMSGLWKVGDLDGASLTVAAFEKLLPGDVGAYIALASVVLFGFSCLISYYTYAERAITYLFGQKSTLVVKIFWICAILIGSQTTLGVAWDLADTINGLMIIPNLIGILLLSGGVVKLKKEYFE